MIGIIVLGHGHFADGIHSSLEMLCDKMENYEQVNYLADDSLDDLMLKLTQAVERLDHCDGLLIYTDIMGGTPFNTAIQLKMRSSRAMEVIGGTNLAALLYGYMSREAGANLSVLAEESVSAGQSALFHFKEPEISESSENYEE